MSDKNISNCFVLVRKYFIIALIFGILFRYPTERDTFFQLSFVERQTNVKFCRLKQMCDCNEGRRKNEMIRMVGGDQQIK